ncbi:MAG: DUF2807 domain-containing protein [Bacteroidales bacterium]|nr:DUF2807 domain-containing protein [Bacteroidales bacterium]
MKKYSISVIFLLLAIVLQAANMEKQNRSTSPFTSIRSSSSIDVVVEQTGQYALEVIAPEKYLANIITEVTGGELHIYMNKSMNYSGEIVVHVQVKDLKSVFLSGSGDFETRGELKAPEFLFRISGSGDLSAQLNSRVVNGSVNGSGDAEISGVTERLELHQSGSGDIIATKLHLLYAKLRMSSSGDCKFVGNSDYFELSQSGSGDFLGRDFDTEDAKIRKSSSGDTRIVVNKSIDISISGSGDLYYSGKPEFNNITVTGSGDIVRINK